MNISKPTVLSMALTLLLAAVPLTAQNPKLLLVNKFGSDARWGANHPRTLGDVNGDGKADVIGFADDGVYVALSDGVAFSAPKRWVASYGATAGGWVEGPHPIPGSRPTSMATEKPTWWDSPQMAYTWP